MKHSIYCRSLSHDSRKKCSTLNSKGQKSSWESQMLRSVSFLWPSGHKIQGVYRYKVNVSLDIKLILTSVCQKAKRLFQFPVWLVIRWAEQAVLLRRQNRRPTTPPTPIQFVETRNITAATSISPSSRTVHGYNEFIQFSYILDVTTIDEFSIIYVMLMPL